MSTLEQAMAEIEALKAKLAVANKPRKLSLKVSEKGAVSLYGMGKFPTTLYRGQWERVLDHAQEIRDFIELNSGLLKTKD